jgi:hypothetical protein
MSALNKVLSLAQGSAPDFRDVSFEVWPDTDQRTELHQETDSSFHFSDRASQELGSLPDQYREQIGMHLDDASDHLADGDLRGAATCLVQACAVAHLQSRHHLAREIHSYSRAVALGGNDTAEPDDAARMDSAGKEVGNQNDNPTASSSFNGRIAATSGLDKVLALAMPAGISSGMSGPSMRMHLIQEHGGMPSHSPGGDLEAAHQHLHAMGAGHTHPEMQHPGVPSLHSAARRVGLTAGRALRQDILAGRG